MKNSVIHAISFTVSDMPATILCGQRGPKIKVAPYLQSLELNKQQRLHSKGIHSISPNLCIGGRHIPLLVVPSLLIQPQSPIIQLHLFLLETLFLSLKCPLSTRVVLVYEWLEWQLPKYMYATSRLSIGVGLITLPMQEWVELVSCYYVHETATMCAKNDQC